MLDTAFLHDFSSSGFPDLKGDSAFMAGGSDRSARIEPNQALTPVAVLHLSGPMRLVAADGTDRTPKGSVRKALLAVLALSPGQARGRKHLEAMFWGGRNPERAGGSLRSALSTLRAELAPLGGPVLEIDSHRVALRPRCISIRCEPGFETGEASLLEGLDLRVTGAEGFEEWLREARARPPLTDPATSARSGFAIAHHIDAQPPRVPGIVLLAPDLDPTRPEARALADSLLTLVVNGVGALSGAEVLDYRDGGGMSGFSPDACATHVLRLTLHEIDGGVALCVRLNHAASRRLVLSATEVMDRSVLRDPHSLVVLDLASQLVDRIAELLADPEEAPRHATSSFHVLNILFRLDAAARTTVKAQLAQAGQTRSALALGLYLDTFEQGESWKRSDGGISSEEARARRLLGMGGAQALDLTLSGYALHYFGHNARLAQDMLVRATELNPALAMAWDHLALFELHRGRLDRACAAAGRALALSRHSPFRHAYETTRCMVATAQGDDRLAVHFGQMALARQPGISAALRHTTSSLGHLRRHAEAESLVQAILTRDPAFTTERIAAGQFRTAGTHHRKRLVDGLRKSGLI